MSENKDIVLACQGPKFDALVDKLMRRRLPFAQVIGVRGDLARPLLLPLVLRLLSARQMTAHRIHRTAHFRRYPPKTEAVSPQNLDFHIHLVRDHRRLKSADLLSSVYQLSIAALYQFTSAGDTIGGS